ncbi:hypothetical protein I5L79_22215 [Hymenobacter sp. BT594]|uniref:Uncharacterized protein n=1 Tax=Hymenobacter guriensis TaxID=2793065 RepID=A0ABS0L9Q3_9BACT|nr:hypothetical protein [Hymenobacter guriensis]
MEASHSVGRRRERARHAGSDPLVSAATRHWVQEADTTMAWEAAGPELSQPATGAPHHPALLYFRP